jgi:hypothetical protein
MQSIINCSCLPTFTVPEVLQLRTYLSEETCHRITKVVTSAFVELAGSLALNLTINAVFGYFFLPASASFLTVACAGALLIVTAIAIAKIWQSCHPSPERPPRTPSVMERTTSTIEDLGRGVARLSFVNTTTIKLSHYIHEFGHYAAALATYVNADPEIIVRWYEGVTRYNISYGLTKFGQWLGEDNALLFVTGAGLLLPGICAMGEFAVAHFLHENHPVISEALNYHGLSQILNVGVYGLSAFFTSKLILKNDFILLWVVGEIHPVIPIMLIVGIPLCEYLIFKYLESKSDHAAREPRLAASNILQVLPR